MKRSVVACLFALGCSSSSPEPVAMDSGVGETADANDACEIPAESNALTGQLSSGSSGGEPAFQAKAVFRIDRAKDPAHPQIVFFSNAVDCAALADESFAGKLPMKTRMLFLELGSAAPGTYPAAEGQPPA